MTKHSTWQDEYWLPLMQVYLKRPVGVKPLYHRDMVDLSAELHLPPEVLQGRMRQLAALDTPRIERLWQTYGKNRRKLARAVSLWRQMRGFGNADAFYEGVELQESFNNDFLPLEEDGRYSPAILILILDLYFHLTPITMIADTPEVGALARLVKLPVEDIVDVLHAYQYCDPYMQRRNTIGETPLLKPCQRIWQRYGNLDPTQLEQLATEMKAYFGS